MAVKNTILGGTDFTTPDARIKPTDLNDTFDAASTFLAWCGSNFKDTAQLIYNAAYIGFDGNLNTDGVPQLKNVFYDVLDSNSADVNWNFERSSETYQTPDVSSIMDRIEYVIIEATAGATWSSNNCLVKQITTGKWLLYCTTGTAAVQRAQIMKSLFFGTDGTNALIDDFTSVTAIKTSHANDVGKQAHYATQTAASSRYVGTFVNTSTNSNCASWSDVYARGGQTPSWEIPNFTIVNQASEANSLELGTDTSGDELNNPATCGLASSAGVTQAIHAVILCVGDITWTQPLGSSGANTDFYTTKSIPFFTAAGTLASEVGSAWNTSYLIFKDTASETVVNSITTWNSSIDGTSSLVVSISYDGGSNYEVISDATIQRNSNTGTALWLKFEVTRTDTSIEDVIIEWATKYNLLT